FRSRYEFELNLNEINNIINPK
ncbi:hypothetical protein LCGC14_1949530, partial [marine sediment metagenome]